MKKIKRDYRHDQKALTRPEAGAQRMFDGKKPPHKYRYDSSLAPEMQWDEDAVRGEAEALIRQITEAEDLQEAKDAAKRLAAMNASFLEWSGKAERGEFHVPTLPLFVHERLSTAAILDTLEQHKRNRTGTLDLFNEGDKSIGEKIAGAYEHKNGWQNRLILGDSLQVMNSLLQYESMGGEVQMVYMDPPYGIKFGGNFQPFVRNRSVADGDDESMSREPEMVQAYRDTWELGTHSWLTYMRDRLLLARELLADSGSCFVQISDENVHLVRNIMDEVFGRENFISLITFRKTSAPTDYYLPMLSDYIIWYGKDKKVTKYNQLYLEKKPGEEGASQYQWLELPDKSERKLTRSEFLDHSLLPEKSKVFAASDMTSSHQYSLGKNSFVFKGKEFSPGGRYWSTSPEGMKRIMEENRMVISGNTLFYKRYWSDFNVYPLASTWNDTSSSFGKRAYIVQTSAKVLQRCILMTTDPGDLVFDPTCGSGTTAYVAEQWGRRWITTDVSRVPLALTRQRLLTAIYPYYELKGDSPSSGFEYRQKKNKRGEEVGGIVPHVTLRSVANDEPPAEEVLVDKPEKKPGSARISGPFCVEAVMPPPISPDELVDSKDDEPDPVLQDSDNHIQRMTRILELSPNIRLAGNKMLALYNVRAVGSALNLHAEATIKEDGKHAAVVFGPANAPINERIVIEAMQEAKGHFDMLLVVAFGIEPAARSTIQNSEKIYKGIKALFVQANMDLAMSDLLKNMRSSEVFAVCGLPEIALKLADKKKKDPLYQVTLLGLDVYDPVKGDVRQLEGGNVPCWMLDTDYDGQCFRARQVFFPRVKAWDKLKSALRADFDVSVLTHLAGNISAPFVGGEQEQIAVKAIDDRGNELLVVKKLSEVEK